MADLRIFSYLPNPRLWKASIAARLCDVELDIRGAKPRELAHWLWDFDARPLNDADRAAGAGTAREARTGFAGRLHKTEAFLDAHPFGTVPAAYSPDGAVGIFESNSIMRAVARLGADRCSLYGGNAYEAARIDSFLDVSLVFARDSQIYLLALGRDAVTPEIHASAATAYGTWMTGLERALAPDRAWLVGESVSLADICFVAELSLFSRERSFADALAALALQLIHGHDADQRYPNVMAHYHRLCAEPAFAPDVGPYLEKLNAGGLAIPGTHDLSR